MCQALAEIMEPEIRQWKAESMAAGGAEGRAEGRAEGKAESRAEDIENVMRSFHVDLQTACESLKITVEEYENAKKLIKESV